MGSNPSLCDHVVKMIGARTHAGRSDGFQKSPTNRFVAELISI